MMSAAVAPFDPRPAGSFPGATSVFQFDLLTGYSFADTTARARLLGQLRRAGNHRAAGDAHQHSVHLSVTGNWNIIGGASIPTAVARMETTGTSRLTSVFAFIEGYGPVETIMPGRGYWVQFSAAGAITLKQ